MNKKALYGILIVLVLPLASYFLLKSSTDLATATPRHYIPDSTIVVTKKGKEYVDTIWHKVADFSLKDHLGRTVSWKDMEGKVIVADFFFTHCPTICPTLTELMRDLQIGIKSSDKAGNRDANFVQFLSFSIDPERDSVAALKKWADRFQVNPQNWLLLTGDKKQIYDLSVKEMKVPAEDGGVIDSNFIHTDVFVLLDKYKNIRGYYHSLITDPKTGAWRPDTVSLAKLQKDIIFLSLEKDPHRKFFLADQLDLIVIVFGVAILGLFFLFMFLKKEKQ
ncbi:MAG: SCO family protein [Candidatus Dadabacteria bacterium]